MTTRSTRKEQVTPLFSAAETNERRRAEGWLASRIERGRREAFSEVVALSPVLAELLLERNPSSENRKMKGTVEAFRRDIIEGRWELNGEPIIVSDTGLLNDGQNRCRAVIDAGRPINTFISFGVGRETRLSTDTGVAKTPGDLLTMQGIDNGNHMAAIAGFLWQIDRFGQIPASSHAASSRPTKQEMQETVRQYEDEIDEALRRTIKAGSHRIASRSLLAVAYVLIGRRAVDKEALATYLGQLVKGASPDNKNPIFAARERLLSEKSAKTLWPHKAIEIILRGWNLHRSKKGAGKIQLTGEWPLAVR